MSGTYFDVVVASTLLYPEPSGGIIQVMGSYRPRCCEVVEKGLMGLQSNILRSGACSTMCSGRLW